MIEEDLVAGFFIEEARVPYTPPPYADMGSLTETEIVFGEPDGSLREPFHALGRRAFSGRSTCTRFRAHDRTHHSGRTSRSRTLPSGSRPAA